MNISKPYFLIVPALISVTLCQLYFVEVGFFVLFNAVFFLLLFCFMCLVISSVLDKYSFFSMADPQKWFVPTQIFRTFFAVLTTISFLGSFFLVLSFSRKFGFSAVFLEPSLLQSNSITNSFGYLLYLNVFIFPVSFLLLIRGEKLFLAVFMASIFFLYFSGIKSYMFQGVLLLFFMFAQGKKVSRLIFPVVVCCLVFVFYFFVYDFLIDNTARSLGSSADRFLAYFSGSWGTFYHYDREGWETPYPALTILYPFYKLISLGAIELSDYNRFYNVGGFRLNVVPFFQLAYLEGGLFLELLVVTLSAFVYSFLRYISFRFNENIFFNILFLYYCSSFLISSLFSSLFLDLQFYLVVIILSTAGVFTSNMKRKSERSSI